MKAPYISYSQEEESIEVMRRVKAMFDPKSILNPYKVSFLMYADADAMLKYKWCYSISYQRVKHQQIRVITQKKQDINMASIFVDQSHL